MVDPRCNLRFPSKYTPPVGIQFPNVPRALMKYGFGYKVCDNYFVKSVETGHKILAGEAVFFGCDKNDIDFVWFVDRIIHIVQPDQINAYLRSEHDDNSIPSCKNILETLLNSGFKHVSGELPDFLTDLVSE